MSRRASSPRPIVFILVYGVVLVLVGITATAQTVLVAAHFATATLNAIVGADAATVRTFVNSALLEEDLAPGSVPSPARAAQVAAQMALLIERAQLVHAEIRALDGRVLFSDDDEALGQQAPMSDAFKAAIHGQAQAAIVDSDGAAAVPRGESEAMGADLAAGSLVRVLLPLVLDGQPRAVVGLWRDATPVLAQLDQTRTAVVVLTLAAALIVSVVLFFVFRGAQSRITRQTRQLVEAARRDALTGMLNHGALVEILVEEVEAGRATGSNTGVALLDIDNFRLLNGTHGHGCGDAALRHVAECLGAIGGPGTVAGRFGPDEFIIVASGPAAADLASVVDRVRTLLSGVSLQVEGAEPLPITVSGGLAFAPTHATSATELLSAATVTLGEAKASGGDRVNVAQTTAEAMKASARSSFNVLRGLVFAVDAKDRYTRRHSEDVARYGVFIAERLGLDRATQSAISVAGLLHDVGKIGVPDEILRKPGRLAPDEMAFVRRHVVLGESLAGDLPNSELVRAGIRHHHEAWNGSGYLDGLAGDEIPLIARILAVGDAFSAMTTTRPYRKALPVEEALIRLGDAAGSQLDERLVRAFVDGIATVPDPPLPGEAVPRLRLLRPAAHQVTVRVA